MENLICPLSRKPVFAFRLNQGQLKRALGDGRDKGDQGAHTFNKNLLC